MTNIDIRIQEEIRLCVLSFDKIAEKYGTTYHHVNLVWEAMCETELSE